MIECEICLEEYQEGHLELHRETCVLRLVFRCTICSEDYVSREGLWNHLDWHEILDEDKDSNYQELKTKYKLLQCDLCNDQRGYSESSYAIHFRNVHDDCEAQNQTVEHEKEVGTERQETTQSKECLECSICRLTFEKYRMLMYHKTVRHKEPTYECTICGKKFHFLMPFSNHKKSCTGLECRECDIKFRKRSRLDKHNKAKHTKSSKANHVETGASQAVGIGVMVTPYGDKNKAVDESVENLHDSEPDNVVAERSDDHKNLNKHSSRPWQCSLCGLTYKDKDTLRHHKFKRHTEPQHKCPICSKSFHFLSQVDRHRKGCSELRCHTCGKKFKNRIHLKMHNYRQHPNYGKLNHVESGSSQAIATEFTATAAMVESIDHLPGNQPDNVKAEVSDNPIKVSYGGLPHQCPICGVVCKDRCNLRHHKIKQHTEPRYTCSICSKSFHFSSDFDRHRKSCSQLRCHPCGLKFTRCSHLKQHNYSEHAQDGLLENDEDSPEAGVEEVKEEVEAELEGPRRNKRCESPMRNADGALVWPCSICQLTFTTQRRQQYHMTAYHRDPKHKCAFCQKLFRNRTIVRRHEKTCSAYRCHKCGIMFASHLLLNSHNKSKHSQGDKTNNMEVTDADILQQESNIEREHAKNEKDLLQPLEREKKRLSPQKSRKEFPCLICGLIFPKTQISYHKITSHTDPRYECSFCRKRFHYLNHLRRHKSVCSGRRCHKCGVMFSSRIMLNNHNISKHSHNDEPMNVEVGGLESTIKIEESKIS